MLLSSTITSMYFGASSSVSRWSRSSICRMNNRKYGESVVLVVMVPAFTSVSSPLQTSVVYIVNAPCNVTRTWLRYVRVFAIANPSVVCLSVTVVRPTQGVETFGNISSPFCSLAILWPPCKIVRRASQGNPSIGGVKCKGRSKIERCHVRVSHLPMSFL